MKEALPGTSLDTDDSGSWVQIVPGMHEIYYRICEGLYRGWRERKGDEIGRRFDDCLLAWLGGHCRLAPVGLRVTRLRLVLGLGSGAGLLTPPTLLADQAATFCDFDNDQH